VLAVGDLHLENFGTWRDADGRLVWGVNDFDEAAQMPYTLDLVRLVASIQLAPRRHQDINDRAAADALLRGYRQGLDDPQPALLFEGETWLRSYALPSEGEPEDFWAEVEEYPKAKPPQRIARALIESLPKGVDRDNIRLCSRRKGGGSLGRPRYVAIGYWRGGRVLREAKALVPSAWIWAQGRKKSQKSNFLRVAKAASGHRIRCCRCTTSSSSAASRAMPRKSSSAITPAPRFISGCCRRWVSTSHRSMPRARAARGRSGRISTSGRAAG
jgi:hypothetical protein